jgi:hypothetical protein
MQLNHLNNNSNKVIREAYIFIIKIKKNSLSYMEIKKNKFLVYFYILSSLK